MEVLGPDAKISVVMSPFERAQQTLFHLTKAFTEQTKCGAS